LTVGHGTLPAADHDAATAPRSREEGVYHFSKVASSDPADAGFFFLFLAAQASRHHHRWLDVRPVCRGVPAAEGVGRRRLLPLDGRTVRPPLSYHHPSPP